LLLKTSAKAETMSTQLSPWLREKTRTALGPVEKPFVITVIGKPGSGKTTLTELLIRKFRCDGAPEARIFNDRDVLLQMAQEQTLSHLIRARDALNFEIVDERAYQVAIHELIDRVSNEIHACVSFIEFSRKDYLKTFAQCAALLAHNKSFVVYLQTPFGICKERNIERAVSENSHSVPSDEMDSYFRDDDFEQFNRKYPTRVMVVENAREKKHLSQQVDDLWSTIKDRTF
jgi:adenylate kinase family enzyme